MSNSEDNLFERLFNEMMNKHEKGIKELEEYVQEKSDGDSVPVNLHNAPFITSDGELVTRTFLVDAEVARKLDKKIKKMGRANVSVDVNKMLEDYSENEND